MRALVVTAANTAEVQDVARPQPGEGEALVRIERAGICGTDMELFHGTMPFIAQGKTTYPLRPGHEWVGRVVQLGAASAPQSEEGSATAHGAPDVAVGDLVTGDTFIGCGSCALCRKGMHYLCPTHVELGVLGNRPGALAEYLVVPVRVLHPLPEDLGATLGALIEPGSCSLRGIRLAQVTHQDRVLVWGTGTLGLLAALFAAHAGAAVSVVARQEADRAFARSLGLSALSPEEAEGRKYDVVVEATGAAPVASRILDWAAPGARIVLLGVPFESVGIPINRAVAADITVFAVLGGSAYIDETAQLYRDLAGPVARLVGAEIELEQVPEVLGRGLRNAPGRGPKTLIRML